MEGGKESGGARVLGYGVGAPRQGAGMQQGGCGAEATLHYTTRLPLHTKHLALQHHRCNP